MPETPPRSYVEYPACEELRSEVDCLWSSGDARPPAGRAMPIFPDGCLDVVLRFRRQRTDAERRAARPALEEVSVVGPMTRAVWMVPHPEEEWIGVRFRPGRAYSFVKVPLNGLVDRTPSAREVLGARLAERLEGIGREHTLAERLRALEETILAVKPGPQAVSAPTTDGVAAIEAAGGRLRVESLCSQLGLSRQHLSREFARHVGLSPKTLARILRFRRALGRARAPEPPSWADVAAELGYCDQAHLIADFGELSGTTPQRYRRLRSRP